MLTWLKEVAAQQHADLLMLAVPFSFRAHKQTFTLNVGNPNNMSVGGKK